MIDDVSAMLVAVLVWYLRQNAVDDFNSVWIYIYMIWMYMYTYSTWLHFAQKQYIHSHVGIELKKTSLAYSLSHATRVSF